MKNLPCIIFLVAPACLVLVGAASSISAPLPLLLVASHAVESYGAAGLLAFLVTDHAPRAPAPDISVRKIAVSKCDAGPAAGAAVIHLELPGGNQAFAEDITIISAA
jgi:hypothetical protein